MKILVNNEVREIEITDPRTGCKWEQDLIGNCDDFDGFDDDREMQMILPETFAWWDNYLRIEQDLQYRAKAVHDGLDSDGQEKFAQAMIDAGDGDFEVMQNSQIQIVEEWESLNLNKES